MTAAGPGEPGEIETRPACRARRKPSTVRVLLFVGLAAAWALAAYFLIGTLIPSDLSVMTVEETAFFTQAELLEAERYERFGRWLWIASTAVLVLVLGAYARWGDRFTHESAAGRIGTGMLLAMLGFAIVWLSQLPFRIVQFWWDHRNEVSDIDLLSWLVFDWIALGSEFLFVCFAILIVMGIAGWLKDRWWLVGGPVFVLLALLFTFVSPYLVPSVRTLDNATLGSAVGVLAAQLDVEDVPVKIQDVDEFTEDANAFAGGLGPSRRVFLWNTLLDGRFSDGEVRVVVAHEFAHHSREHLWKSVGIYALFAIPGAYLIALATRRRGSLYNATAVPVALFVFVLLNVVSQPIDNALSRRYEAEADWVALEATRDPAAARALFKNFSSTALQDPTPPGWAYVWLSTHPTLLQRIAMANAWEERRPSLTKVEATDGP